jgi:hypothetical protein
VDKSQLAWCSYEEGKEIGWTQEEIAELESGPTRKYYKEPAHKLWSNRPISQTSSKISLN